MPTVLLVVLVVSGALIVGAAWGVYGRLSAGWEGFLIALAGGALVVAVVSELIEPAIGQTSLALAMGGVAAGAAVFTGLDWLVDEKWGADSGGGLLVAITLDGVPENLALGVALIAAGPTEVAALAGSILLSNLPEAAGGAKEMAKDGRGKAAVMGLWIATARAAVRRGGAGQSAARRRLAAPARHDPVLRGGRGRREPRDRGVSQGLS